MATMALGYQDRVESGTLTASGSLATQPVVNLKDPALSPRIWIAGDNSEWVQVDFGVSRTIGVVGLFGFNGTATATKRIRLSNNSDMSAPTIDTGVVNAGVDINFRALIHVLSTPTAGRYLRVDVADAAISIIQAARLVAMSAFRPTRGIGIQLHRESTDTTRIQVSESGQSWVEQGVVRREWRLQFHALTDAEVDGEFNSIMRLGRADDVLVVLDPASTNLGRDSLLGLILENLSAEHRSLEHPNRRSGHRREAVMIRDCGEL